MSSLRSCTAGPESLSCLIKGPNSAHALGCLCDGLEADIKPLWPEIPLEVGRVHKTGLPECYEIYTETNDDIMDNRETECPALVWRKGP